MVWFLSPACSIHSSVSSYINNQEERGLDNLNGQRIILALVFFIVFLDSLAKFIFEGFSLKTLLILLAVSGIVLFLWIYPNKKDWLLNPEVSPIFYISYYSITLTSAEMMQPTVPHTTNPITIQNILHTPFLIPYFLKCNMVSASENGRNVNILLISIKWISSFSFGISRLKLKYAKTRSLPPNRLQLC